MIISLDDYACSNCGHVQTKNFGGSDFLRTLYDKDKLQERWAADGSTPYAEIASQAFEFAKNTNIPTEIVYDFGAGDLEVLLAGCNDNLWLKENCLAIDFNITRNKLNIPARAADLSGKFAENLLLQVDRKSFDLGFCTHLLEHLENPLEFLKEVKKLANQKSILYIEVPDHANVIPEDLVTASLYCIQHIHFFSLNSLIHLINQAGWEVLGASSKRHGWVPRLCVFVVPENKTSITSYYNLHNTQLVEYGIRFRSLIIEYKNNNKPFVIWGVGTDFHQLLNPGNVLLEQLGHDTTLVDKRFHGERIGYFKIENTDVLWGYEGTIFCAVSSENSRATMRAIAQKNFPSAILIFPS